MYVMLVFYCYAMVISAILLNVLSVVYVLVIF